jgi:hypothetical protein
LFVGALTCARKEASRARAGDKGTAWGVESWSHYVLELPSNRLYNALTDGYRMTDPSAGEKADTCPKIINLVLSQTPLASLYKMSEVSTNFKVFCLDHAKGRYQKNHTTPYSQQKEDEGRVLDCNFKRKSGPDKL